MLPRALLVLAFLTMAFACTSGTTVTTPTTPTAPKTAVTTSVPARGNPGEAGPLVIAQPVDPLLADPQLDALPREAPVCGVRLEGSRTVIIEGRSVRLSGAQVTAGSIMERWEMQDSGISEHLTSARLSTAAGAAGTTISVGSVVTVGAERYCVVDILYGRSEPGSVSLQKVAR